MEGPAAVVVAVVVVVAAAVACCEVPKLLSGPNTEVELTVLSIYNVSKYSSSRREKKNGDEKK